MKRHTSRFGLIAIPGGLVALSAVAVPSVSAADAMGKPNILLIVADDLGYGELGCQGNKQIPTPNIDSIATNGIRFTSGYVTAPVCSPSRAGLMTGRYGQRFGYESNPQGKDVNGNFGLSTAEKTFADRMKAAGYVTGLFGKWHLGYKPQFAPMNRGFDDFLGFLRAQHDYVRNTGIDPICHGKQKVKSFEYTTDLFARETAAFIEQHRAQPWLACLSFNAVHIPLQALDRHMKPFAGIADKNRRTFAGMVSAMDDAVGVVLAKLRELQIEDDTLIVFLSDNGGPTGVTTSSNLPLRGFKGDVYEGGIRIPFLMQWKKHLPCGKTEDRPVISLDILPTALAAGGIKPPEDARLEGINLLPYLTTPTPGAPHAALFWRYNQKHAVRMGDWKLVNPGSGDQLYNLASDIGEAHDLASQKPAKVKELLAAYGEWNAKNVVQMNGGKKTPSKKTKTEGDE